MAEPSEAQRKRAEARDRRRSQSKPKPAESSESSVDDNGSDGEQPLDAVKQAAKVAAAGAAVGAAAAAARALTSHRDDEQGSEAEDQTESAATDDEEPQQPDRLESNDDQEPKETVPPETHDQQDEHPTPVAESRGEQSTLYPEPRPEEDDVEGATPEDAAAIVQRAREQLEELLERRVESVSSFAHTHSGWLVRLEVVEVTRIPESTDVMASYEMELDEDRKLRRYARVHRYYRSQADWGEQS